MYSVIDVRVEYYIVLSMYERKQLENDVVDVIYGHNVIYEGVNVRAHVHVDVHDVVLVRIEVGR